MQKFLFAAAVSLAGLTTSVQAGGCDSPFCQGQSRGFFGGFHSPIPAFQAAPWYHYWPYNSHFMTPAPVPGYGGGYYGAQSAPGGGLINPYFPAGGFGYNIPSASASSSTPPAPMPAATPSTTPGAATSPLSPVPGVPVQPLPPAAPPVSPAPSSPPPGVSIPVIPSAPGVIRAGGRR